MAKTERLDLLVVERGLFDSREVARTAIMDGVVLVDGQKATKPGAAVRLDAQIQLVSTYAPPKFVSRGGLKLEKALSEFACSPKDRTCLDIGASTGGFTDCLLKHGATRVFAIDVGYGQLDWSLRNDPRVVVLERVNARHLTVEQLYGDAAPDATLAVIDVSFISLLKVMPPLLALLAPQKAEVIALVKPQFEAGKSQVGKGGVVRSAEAHITVLANVIQGAADLGFRAMSGTFSPVKGPKGNIEFLVQFGTGATPESDAPNVDVDALVAAAHTSLN